MRNLVLASLLLTGLSGCIGDNKVSTLTDNEAMYCVNRSEIIDDANAPLARMCGENSSAAARRSMQHVDHTNEEPIGALVIVAPIFAGPAGN